MSKHDMVSSGNNEWETPLEIFEQWNQRFSFKLDVCASVKNAKIQRFYTVKDNGLDMPWSSSNWCNPPYGVGQIVKWLRKARVEAENRGVLTCLLLPVATSTAWWQAHVKTADHVFYYPHRINFLKDGVVVKGAAFDPCIVIWGLHP